MKYLNITIITIAFIIIKYLKYFILNKFSREKIASIKYQDVAIECIVNVAILIALIVLWEFVNKWNSSKIYNYILGILSASVFITYNFIIEPILNVFHKTKFEDGKSYEDWLYKNFNYNIKVKITDQNIINAFAVGVIPFSKIILLGKPLINKMTDDELKGVLLHELGHTIKNHVLILYLSNVLICSFFVISSSYLYPQFSKLEWTPFWVALSGGFWGLMFVVIPGLIQRKLENSADWFAAKIIGVDIYANALNKLDTITNGKLTKKSINYPTLEHRIKYIQQKEIHS